MLNSNELHEIKTTIALLQQHHKVHWLSVVTTAVALLVMALLSVNNLFQDQNIGYFFVIASTLAVLLGLAQTLMAVRVGFDQQLLERLSSEQLSLEQSVNLDLNAHLTQLDASLVTLKLIPQQQGKRTLIERLHGCIVLFKYQCFCCIFQLISVCVGALVFNL